MRRDASVADGGEQSLLVLQRQRLEHRGEPAVLAQLAELELVACEIALEDLAPEVDAARALLQLDPSADFRARPR